MTAQLVQHYKEAQKNHGDKAKYRIVLFGYDKTKSGQEKYLEKAPGMIGVKSEHRKAMADALKVNSRFLPNLFLLKSDSPQGQIESNNRKDILAKVAELSKAE